MNHIILPADKILELDSSMKEKALAFATKKHLNQTRLDGSPYINHPKRVAENIQEFKKSKYLNSLIIGAYLHDVLEDTDTTYNEIAETFSPLVASLVQELTNNEQQKKLLGKTKYLEEKMIHMTNWALTIKLCDRLDNVSDLVNGNIEFQKKYITETLKIINYLVNNRDINNTQINLVSHILQKLYIQEQLTENQCDIIKKLRKTL